MSEHLSNDINELLDRISTSGQLGRITVHEMLAEDVEPVENNMSGTKTALGNGTYAEDD